LKILPEKNKDMKKILSIIIFLAIFITISGQENFTDKRDGNVYRTITIDGVKWMAENLKFKAKEGAYFFDNDLNNMPGYGVLYEWKAALNNCPVSWHLPSGKEFQTLINHFELKETWGKVPSDPSSFGIQLGGMQDYDGIFSEMDESGYYWSSTEYDAENAEYFSYLIIDEMPVIDISRKEDIADIHGTEKTNKYSVRCVKD
jgi:uncharacterized protein (TIGR02145 family)